MSCCGIPVNSILICAQERDVEAVFLIHLALLTCGIVAWKMSYRGLRSKLHECALVFSLSYICFKVCVTITECTYMAFNDKSSVEVCVPSLSW